MIEALSKKIMEGEKIDINLALEYLDAYWEGDGYENETAERQAREDAVEILETFLEEQEKMTTEIVDVERNFTMNLGNYSITGFIDRIDRNGDDYIIWDYKTSKSTISENELKKDLQLLIYDMAISELFGKRPKQVGLWYLRHNKKVVIEPREEDIENIKKEILA